MTNEHVRAIFDKAVQLEPGQHIRIDCTSRAEQDSVRTQLYKQRTMYLRSAGEKAINLGISRVTLNEKAAELLGRKFSVVLRHSPAQQVSIVSADGSEEQIAIVPTVPEALDEFTAQQNRTLELMLSDGWSRAGAIAFITNGSAQNKTEGPNGR